MGHKCYISFKTEDSAYKQCIQSDLDVDMIDKSLDEPIQSNDEDYILRKIREDYLADSTVTIHLIGQYSAESLGKEEQRFIKRERQGKVRLCGDDRSEAQGAAQPVIVMKRLKGRETKGLRRSTHNFAVLAPLPGRSVI